MDPQGLNQVQSDLSTYEPILIFTHNDDGTKVTTKRREQETSNHPDHKVTRVVKKARKMVSDESDLDSISNSSGPVGKKRRINVVNGLRRIPQKTMWTEVEDLQVMKAWQTCKGDWKKFAEHVPRFKHIGSKLTEYPYFCIQRMMYLDHLMPTTKNWTEYQVDTLLSSVKRYQEQNERIHWLFVAKSLKRVHDGEECRIKYYSLQDLSKLPFPDSQQKQDPNA